MECNASVEKLIKRMTADHLVDGALLSPLREFVCEPSKMMGMSVLEVMNGKSALQHVTEKMKMSSCYQHEKTSNGMGWKISGKVSSLSTDAQVDKAGSSSRNARHARSAELERFKKCEIKHYQEQDTSVSSLVSSVHVGEEQNHGTFINEKLQQGLKVNGEGATHVKQLKSGNLEEGSRAPFLIKENRQSKKWLKKHEKACAQHVDKASHLIPCSSGKEKKKLLQDDAMVIPNMRSSPPLEMSVSPPACSELPTPSVYARTIRVIQQEWVSCDNCEKWRLLPPGLGSAELPAKWTCKSLYWLPGLNKCKVSEELTTKLVDPHYDALVGESIESIPSVTQHRDQSHDIKRARLESSNKFLPGPSTRENEPLSASMQLALPAKLKKPLDNAVIDKGQWMDMQWSFD